MGWGPPTVTLSRLVVGVVLSYELCGLGVMKSPLLSQAIFVVLIPFSVRRRKDVYVCLNVSKSPICASRPQNVPSYHVDNGRSLSPRSL